MSQLAVSDLTVEFRSGGYIVRPVNQVSFAASDGEFVAVLGPSGCGKTTLLSCIAALMTPTAGCIRFGATEVTALAGRARAQYRRHTVGVVFQAFNLIPSLTAHGNVVAPLHLAGVPRRAAAQRASELLERVGLADRARHRPGQLSGGQQQRVALARALVHEPPLIVADEPTAYPDHTQVEEILQLLHGLAAPGRMVLVATHDDRVTRLADQVVELVPRRTASGREPEGVVPADDLVVGRRDMARSSLLKEKTRL